MRKFRNTKTNEEIEIDDKDIIRYERVNPGKEYLDRKGNTLGLSEGDKLRRDENPGLSVRDKETGSEERAQFAHVGFEDMEGSEPVLRSLDEFDGWEEIDIEAEELKDTVEEKIEELKND